MAGFKTHITTSTVVGVGYGVAGAAMGVPVASCCLAGGLCSVAGMLPDLDSDSGIPIRESFAFLAAVVPMLMVSRFEHMGMPHEAIVLAGGMIYIAIRFGVAEIFRRYTVHRGMWHSVPAALTAGLLAFLICETTDLRIRIFWSAAVVLGFMTHLVLDEIWSVEMRRGRLRFKKSFGTAIKFWSRRSLWANLSTYGKLIVVTSLVVGDPLMMEQFHPQGRFATPRTANQIWSDVWQRAGETIHNASIPRSTPPSELGRPTNENRVETDLLRPDDRPVFRR